MPKLFKNILTVVALAAIVVQAIVLAVQRPEFWWTALLIAVLGAAGVLCMRFAYKIAEWHNRSHSLWHKRNPDMDWRRYFCNQRSNVYFSVYDVK